ncbi:hypothetical protein TrST_g5641 [Triparma strigata]|uniref:Protein kinase domain-containing protein n=1 Tax=Triparma strigata TaxID=1606541 RepID=A0A9W6ZTS3_9STRA|nr:hypothetical protein TrST_g5641 [Triparma strigata]
MERTITGNIAGEIELTREVAELAFISGTGDAPSQEALNSIMILWSRIVSSQNFFHVCQTCHPAAIVEYISQRLKKSGLDGGVADILAKTIVDNTNDDGVLPDDPSEDDYTSNASVNSAQHVDDSQFNFVGTTSEENNTSPDSHLSATLSPTNLKQNQIAFLRATGGQGDYDEYEYGADYEEGASSNKPREFDGGSDGYDEYEYGGDYDSDYENDSGGDNDDNDNDTYHDNKKEKDPLKKTSPRGGLNIPKISRTFSDGSDTGVLGSVARSSPRNFPRSRRQEPEADKTPSPPPNYHYEHQNQHQHQRKHQRQASHPSSHSTARSTLDRRREEHELAERTQRAQEALDQEKRMRRQLEMNEQRADEMLLRQQQKEKMGRHKERLSRERLLRQAAHANRHPQNFLHNPSALNRETSVNSSFSDIPEDLLSDNEGQEVTEELMGSNASLAELKVNHDMSLLTISPTGPNDKLRISPPTKTQSPPLTNVTKSRYGVNGALPPPPPEGSAGGLFRSMSTDDAYSSDEDHVEKGHENYSPAKPAAVASTTMQQHRPANDPIKQIVREPFTPSPEPTNNDTYENDGTVSSINSSSGSVGKRLVKQAMTREHPKGATVSRKERVRKGKWRKGQKIGSGSFGTVYLGMNEASGTLMAIKTMNIANAEQSDIEDLQQEIDVMRILSHPNIVRYFGAELDDEEGSLNIFQEWVPGGSVASLLSRLGAFSVNVVKSYLKQTLSGLAYLHKNHIIHRDMKGANLLVDNNGTVKLADFGASKKMSDEGTLNGSQMTASMKGTPYFMAPEVMSHEKYGRKADMWSTGGVAFQMITGEAPWKSLGLRTPVALFYHIQTGDEPPPLPEKVKKECPGLCRIILRCFARDPAKRPKALELLNDEWFREDEGDDDSETTMSEGGVGDDWIDAEGDGQEFDDDRRQRTNSGSLTGVAPDRKRTASSGSRHHKFGENGYAEVAAFDVQTAKKRAELKSQRGGNSGGGMGNGMANGNSPTYADIPQNAADLLQGKDIKQIKGSRPVTTATGRQWADVDKKVEEGPRRPATTKVGRSETPYEDAEDIPQEWPSWAKEKAQVKAQILRSSTEGTKKSGSSTPPGPPARDSPASQYATPPTGLGKGNPFGDTGDVGVSILQEESDEDSSSADEYMSPKNEERIAMGGNPFETGASPKGKVGGPKPSTDSPTSMMAGPRIDQYLEESVSVARRGSNGSERRGSTSSRDRRGSNSSAGDRRRSSGDRSSLVKPPEGPIPTPSISNPQDLEKTEVDTENWICAHCMEKNSNGQDYCSGCAKWKKVAGGVRVKGEERAVVNLDNAWETTVKSNNFGTSGQQSNIGAVRHQLQRAHTSGTHAGGNSRSGGGSGAAGSRSAGPTSYREKPKKF